MHVCVCVYVTGTLQIRLTRNQIFRNCQHSLKRTVTCSSAMDRQPCSRDDNCDSAIYLSMLCVKV